MNRTFNWRSIKFVFFDIDGTLYCKNKMRKFILKKLLSYYLLRIHKIKDLYVLYKFRKYREWISEKGSPDFETEQYSIVAEKCHTSSGYVKELVDLWIMKRPLPYLLRCRFPDILVFIKTLHNYNIKTFSFSDYPAKEKILSLELPIQVSNEKIFCLKPSSYGIMNILKSRCIDPIDCVLIGDRLDRDGECAKNIGMHFLIKDHINNANGFRTYTELKNELDESYRD